MAVLRAESKANSVAPVISGLIYQQYGMTAPFLVGAVVITVLLGASEGVLRRTMLAQAIIVK